MVTISHCTHNRTDTSFTNIWNSKAKPPPNESQNENMNNEKQMVFSKQNFNQAIVAAKTQKHVTVIGKFLSMFLPPLEPV